MRCDEMKCEEMRFVNKKGEIGRKVFACYEKAMVRPPAVEWVYTFDGPPPRSMGSSPGNWPAHGRCWTGAAGAGPAQPRA
jgi:hypothetical protein